MLEGVEPAPRKPFHLRDKRLRPQRPWPSTAEQWTPFQWPCYRLATVPQLGQGRDWPLCTSNLCKHLLHVTQFDDVPRLATFPQLGQGLDWPLWSSNFFPHWHVTHVIIHLLIGIYMDRNRLHNAASLPANAYLPFWHAHIHSVFANPCQADLRIHGLFVCASPSHFSLNRRLYRVR